MQYVRRKPVTIHVQVLCCTLHIASDAIFILHFASIILYIDTHSTLSRFNTMMNSTDSNTAAAVATAEIVKPKGGKEVWITNTKTNSV